MNKSLSPKEQALKDAALDYHQNPVAGKLDISSSKKVDGQADLSLAYSPGVAYPCLDIAEDETKIYDYTARGNTVAVITDGTAVLGLGNIGPKASMPVMEGKCVLLKEFAGINGVPLAIAQGQSPTEFVEMVAKMEPSFGAINLEDIKAPECFEIETKLQEKMDIPVFHDDQHGTAVISTAAILNSLKLLDKTIGQVKIVINGAGAAAIASAKMYLVAGAKLENIFMLDSRGLIFNGRSERMNEYKQQFANGTEAATLGDVVKDADVFVGMSVGNILTQEMVKSMAENPIVLALANPTPEIAPELALGAGAAVVATGRSDLPNQVNNVLGFPGIFRGALDARAKKITEEMKFAAVKALMELTEEAFPEDIKTELKSLYPADAKNGMFDKENPLATNYVIPKPFDKRVVERVAKAVAAAV